jgi:hypothetical protein
MKKILILTLITFAVAFGYTYNVDYYTSAGVFASKSFTATDTVFSQEFDLQGKAEVSILTNLTGTANAGNYINNDIQGYIGGTWVTIATDSAGVGYSQYVMRTSGTITIPAEKVRLRTRRYRASSTLTALQQITGF